MLKVKIDEKLNVNKNNSKVAETLREQIEEALPILEEAIIERLGNDSFVRNFDFGLKVDEGTDRYGKTKFEITSNNLLELTGPIGKTTYKSYEFCTWGGTIDTEENQVWFNPKFSFSYIEGGSNGCDALWSSIWYDITEHDWIFGRKIS